MLFTRLVKPNFMKNGPSMLSLLCQYNCPKELYELYGCLYHAANVILDHSQALQIALQAPSKFRHSMSDASTFPIIWDSGTSTASTFAKSDFVVSFCQFTSPVSLSGVAQKVTIEGEGKVRWSILDQHGSLCTLTVPALYIPKSSV